jgi:hypothetical protein
LPEGQFNGLVHGRKWRFDCVSVSYSEACGLYGAQFPRAFGGDFSIPRKQSGKRKVELEYASDNHSQLRCESVSCDQ